MRKRRLFLARLIRAYLLSILLFCVSTDGNIYTALFMQHYVTSPYYNEQFLADYVAIGKCGYLDEDAAGAYHECSLTYYGTPDGYRKTTDQPATYTRTVWMLGNSTLWGIRVADGWTTASYLQRDLNGLGLRWRVVNTARLGSSVRLELRDLKRLTLRRGDVVIMFDGAWDYYNNVRGKSAADKARNMADFWRVITEARTVAHSRGAAFYHFLQPGTGIDYSEYAVMAHDDPMLYVSPEYFFDDIHLDDRGHEQIASTIYAALSGPF